MKSKCLRPTCKGRAHCRGLCRPCYMTAAKLVNRGRTTWAKLVRAKKALPPRTPAEGPMSRVVADRKKFFLEQKEA